MGQSPNLGAQTLSVHKLQPTLRAASSISIACIASNRQVCVLCLEPTERADDSVFATVTVPTERNLKTSSLLCHSPHRSHPQSGERAGPRGRLRGGGARARAGARGGRERAGLLARH